MIPNVYGMSQHACGPVMMKRPYISSSNYIDKMSSYKRKPDIYPLIKLKGEQYEWYEIYDALLWYFIDDNHSVLSKNYATANMAKLWKSKTMIQQNALTKRARAYINKYGK